MANEKLILTARPIIIAETVDGDETCKYATFLISVLDEWDRMGRMITKDAGEKYHATLRGFPVVAKLLKDRANRPIDFGGHEMRQWIKRNGETETTFDTYPIGSIIDTWIESRQVSGYDGERCCIMAKAKLWSCRSPEYFKVLDRLWAENKVSSSWELIVTQAEEDSLGRKILRAFSFIGNALLGTTSVPAVRGAGICEYAEAEDEYCQTTKELTEALLKDIKQEVNTLEPIKDTQPVENESEVKESIPTEVSDEGSTEKETISEDLVVTKGTGAEDSHIESESEDTSSNSGEATGEPEVSEASEEEAPSEETDDSLVAKIDKLTNALIDANAENERLKGTIEALNREIEEMAPMKEEFERIAREKEAAEKQSKIDALKQLALNSKQIKESELAEEGGDETIKALIANLDEAGLKTVIVERLINSHNTPVMREVKTASVESKSTGIKLNILDNSTSIDMSDAAKITAGADLVSAVINR